MIKWSERMQCDTFSLNISSQAEKNPTVKVVAVGFTFLGISCKSPRVWALAPQTQPTSAIPLTVEPSGSGHPTPLTVLCSSELTCKVNFEDSFLSIWRLPALNP